MRFLSRLTDRLEETPSLDHPSEVVNEAVTRVIRPGMFKDVLSGTALGHPLHPMLVQLPIGCWTSAMLLDLVPGAEPAARGLIGAGVLAAVPAALSGSSDWSDTRGAEQRVGTAHAALNTAAVALYAASWWGRRRGRGGRLLSLAGAAAATCAGYLGGHLVYGMGVGVDTNAFEIGPTEWRPVLRRDDLRADESRSVTLDGVSILLAQTADGRVHALANRCSHRGGPLSDGPVEDGCVTCPWHDSRFNLEDGDVVRGPATRPQPVYRTRVNDGNIEICREEPRTLRTNPV